MQPLAPEYRGSARQCLTCNGLKIINVPFSPSKSLTCDTCQGSGVVHPGIYCEECGRSVQYEYKGHLICGNDFCQISVDLKIKEGKYSTKNLWESADVDDNTWYEMYGLV